VSGGKNEAVPVEPAGIVRVKVERVAEEHRADFRASEGQTEVTGSAGVHRIHGKTAGLIGRFGEKFSI
jgi:hypothetical protein